MVLLLAIVILLMLSDAAVCARLPLPGPQAPTYEVLSVGDGDGIKVKGPGEKTLRIRFSCIDAPELKQELGQESKDALMHLVPVGSIVKLSISPEKETHYRTLADVYVVDPKTKDYTLNANLEMVRRGYAFVYCHYLQQCDAGAYYAAEVEARDACRGVWKKAGGIQRPWNWRSVSKGKRPFPNDCPTIKSRPTCWITKIRANRTTTRPRMKRAPPDPSTMARSIMTRTGTTTFRKTPPRRPTIRPLR